MAQQITITLRAEELVTVLTALESEWEHAQDAARDAHGDDAQVAQYRAIAARNDRLRAKLATLGPMTTHEAAQVLGLTPATLRQQIANGSLRATKRGRDWWLTGTEVERYRRESLGKPGPRKG